MASQTARAMAARKKKRKPTFWERVEAGANNVVRGGKQVIAGALESTIADTGSAGGYRPAILDSVPATVGVLKSLASAVAPNYVDAPTKGGYLDQSMQRAQRGYDRTNRYLGITDPENTLETILRIGGSLAVPAKLPGAGSVGRATRKAAPRSKVAQQLAKAADSKAGRLAGKVTRGVAEVAVPMRQTGPKGAAVVTGIGTALREGIDAVADSEEYAGIADALKTEEPADEFAYLNEATEAEDEFSYLDGEADEATIDEIEEEEKLIRWETAGLTLGAVLGGAAIAKYGKQFVSTRLLEGAKTVEPRFTGKKFRRSQGGLKERAKAAIVQQDEPIRSIADRFLGKDYAKKWGYRADRVSNVALGSKLRDQFITGRMVGTNQRTVRLAPLGQSWAKELSFDEQNLISDALVAASALDDFRATGTLAALNTDRFGQSVGPRDLEALVLKVRTDPKLAKYFSDVQQSYRDLAKFRQLRGMDTADNVQRMLERRPNYVGLHRNLETDAPITPKTGMYSANDDVGFAPQRATDEAAGVQGATGVGNPFITLWDDWSGAVRRAELNDLRKDVLLDLERVNATAVIEGQTVPLIKRLSPDAKDADNVHTVFINGKQQKFQVNDPAMTKALHFAPRASIKALEVARQFTQSVTTGPLATLFNGFALIKSPIYDTMLGMLNRPKGTALGLGNELLGTNLPDPTALVSAYSGAVRYMWDDMRGAMATNLASHMYRENSWLRDMLGDANVSKLADKFEQAYEASVKAEMDQLGITSITMHGSPDPSKLLTGVEDVAPAFSQNVVLHANRDIAEEAAKGNIGPIKALVMQGQNKFANARADVIARAYGGVIEAMHNGFRYQALATNRNRVNQAGSIGQLDKLASDLRRISGDASQHGGSDIANKTLGSFMYANLGVQSLYQLGRTFRDNPVNGLFNLTATASTLAALHYGALASDPEVLQKHRDKTTTQKASSLITFGGAEIPLDPIMRAIIAPAFVLLDHISGYNAGEFNPDFLGVMDSWLEGDNEELSTEMGTTLARVASDNNPFQLSGLPAYNIALATAGVDPGMSRYTGETAMVREQDITGTDKGSKRVDSMVSGYTENMIASIFSTTGRNALAMADDVFRAYGKGAPIQDALGVAGDRWSDEAAKSSGIFKPMLFGDREEVKSIADTNWEMFKAREPGIEQAVAIMGRDVKGGGITSTNNDFAAPMPIEGGVVPDDIVGTELQVIAEYTQQLNTKVLADYKAQLKQLNQQTEGVQNFYMMPQDKRRRQINSTLEDRKYLTLMMLQATKQYEELISAKIGRPFSYDDFNVEEHRKPIAQ